MVQPLCKYFGRCNGCSLQHIDYEIQLENKKSLLKNIVNIEIKAFPSKEYFYRNKMEFIFSPNGLGLRQKANKIINVDKCVICNEKINKILNELNSFSIQWDYFVIKKQSGTFRYAVIRTSDNATSVSFVLNADSSRIKEAIEKIKGFSDISSADNISVTYVPSDIDESRSEEFFVIKGSDILKERYLDKEFEYSVQGFFQNNHQTAENMQRYCNELLKRYDTKDAHLLDLYAGVGCFGIINSEIFKSVKIVESLAKSIESAEMNTKNNNVKNAEAISLDAKQLKKLSLETPLFVILDPPRSGMDNKTIEELKMLDPEVIIYISCNPEQLKKDLPKFNQHKIKSAALFDMFPQTNHCESVVELVKQ